MNMSKKKILVISAFSLLSLLLSNNVFADDSAVAQLTNPLGENSQLGVAGVINLINQLIKFVLGFTGLIALIVFIYGGILWMISLGDSNKVKKAKDAMIWSIYGLLVIFASYAIVLTLFQAFGISK